MRELIGAWPKGHELKVLGKHFSPDLGESNALSKFTDSHRLADWIYQCPINFEPTTRWIPDLIWLNCLQDLKFGDELSQTLAPEKIPLVANIRILRSQLGNEEFNRLLRVDQLICASNFGAQTWRDMYGFDVRVIPNAVNLQKFYRDDRQRLAQREKLNLHETDKLLLFIGRIEPCKGINDLIYILQEIQKLDLDYTYHLAVVGKQGKLPGDFAQQIASLRPKNLGIYPYTAHPEIWLQAADVMLLPSRWDELFGKVIVEAMACEVPVLATANGGIPEILEPKFPSLLMDSPCDPGQWANAIEYLVRKRDTYGPALRKEAEKYSADTLAKTYLELFETVV